MLSIKLFDKVSNCNIQRQTYQTYIIISQINYINTRFIACQTRRHCDFVFKYQLSKLKIFLSLQYQRKENVMTTTKTKTKFQKKSRESDNRNEAIKRAQK